MLKKLLLTILLIPQIAIATETVVINGLPMKNCNSGNKGTNCTDLPEEKQNEFRLLITKKNGNYLWTTRNNKKLKLVKSGLINIFTAVDGAGYIRIVKVGGKVEYMEHLPIALTTVTYWGTATNFEP